MAEQRRIYLDHAATTPLLPEVKEAMAPWLEAEYGNPSSLYAEGRKARAAIDAAREVVAGALGCEFGEVVFTSSGTEAANLAIVGAALGNPNPSRRNVIISAVEHHCVLNTRPLLERLGYTVDLIPVDRYARPNTVALRSLLGENALLVAAMSANNELGTLTDTASVATMARSCGALYFCDAVQSFDRVDCDLAAYSAHKINGPKGAGALYVKAGTKINPILYGGGQERELRAGTENVAAIVGFGEAVIQRTKSTSTVPLERAKETARDSFLQRLYERSIEGLQLSAPSELTLKGHAHIRIEGASAETLLILLDRMGVSASSGSACSSGSIEPSHVLLACGYSVEEAKEGLRFTFGIANTVEEAARAADLLAEAVMQIRGDYKPPRSRRPV